jgi:hypothetical protein
MAHNFRTSKGFNPALKFDLLSPDGFSIKRTGYFKTIKGVKSYFDKWLSCYKIQGYYSSVNYGRISLEELERYCTLVNI